MGGNLADKNITISTLDNFHRVWTTAETYYPLINNTCNSTVKNCTLNTISVTENNYPKLSNYDDGSTEIGALEMKAKLVSRQALNFAAGNYSADFHELDETGSICKDINTQALEWALSHSSKDALSRYNKTGNKLTLGEDTVIPPVGAVWSF